MKTVDCDYFVVGSGMAGLMSALHLSSYGSVTLVTKGRLADCNTNFAQGGICCVMDPADSFDRHARDTMIAGAWLGRTEVVHEICENAPAGIQDLIDCGVKFARRPDGSWDLTREGGHSARRILHAGDITGEKCEAAMIRRVRRSGADIREQTIVVDLIMTRRLGLKGENRCVGAYVLDKPTGEIYAVRSANTILATGGCGKVYLYTCNPDSATGDGVALAWRAGAKIENMEFVQFHPTCLFHPQAKRFLISEAVRGEGAVLVDRHGREFMRKYDPRGSLAPRDIVARSIDSEMKRTGDDCVFLDIRKKGRAYLMKRFPNIYQKCMEFGIDMASDLIPVVPAAHYSCGGIQATTDGRTSIPGLSAVGECASTGLHGANRLASNSLMEALVCARLTAAHPGVEDRERGPARRGGARLAHVGRDPPPDVGLRGDRPHQQAPRARGAPAAHAPPRDPRLLLPLPGDAGHARAEEPRRLRGADREERAEAPRKPRPPLHPRLPPPGEAHPPDGDRGLPRLTAADCAASGWGARPAERSAS